MLVGLLAAIPRMSSAYEIHTGLTHGCHEEIAAAALTSFFATDRMDLSTVPLPTRTPWKPAAEAMFNRLNVSFSGDPQRFMAFSLILGARWPDVLGRSITNSEAMYANHGGIDDQNSHFLRAPHHDGHEGDAEAAREGVAFIRSRIDSAASNRHRVIRVDEYIEYYGPVSLEVWAPAFHIGNALHALHDSFSHTVRSADLQRIYHVMNFVDAITADYDETRDGLAHSFAMDECEGETAPMVAEAESASLALLEFFVDENWTPQILFDTWLTFESGCTFENNFCDSPWVELARTDTTGPILKTFAGCTVAPSSQTEYACLAAFITGMILFGWRLRRRRKKNA